MQYDTTNEMFSLAVDLVNSSSRSIFLTGKAGTGKTTFLKYIREHCSKNIAVVAPTGVAAINAGGVTIHSFFQLPLSPFIPGIPEESSDYFNRKASEKPSDTVNRHDLISRLRLNSEKIKVLQELELLVIDEISMVRSDTVDAIDTVLRHARKRPFDRFGGVQVLFIGDMFQLPPVVRSQEWKLLSPYYQSPFFFDSLVVREELPLYVEFSKIYRQSEENFIRLLNQVRNNRLDEEGFSLLESRFQPQFRRTENDGYIILTTHNDSARETNRMQLQQLPGLLFTYPASIELSFPENAYPADELLQLKVGAQVMFIKNDVDKARRYFNGKIGQVIRLEKDKIFVQCDQEPEIEVKKEKWENIHYTVDKASRQISSDVLGSFSQYPLRLAWAITIHKSQGLTFEKAIIDAGDAFAPGQVYVGLSRCTSLSGVVLKSKVRTNSLSTDPRISQFSSSSASAASLKMEVEQLGRKYLESILLSSFDFERPIQIITELISYLGEFSTSFNAAAGPWSRTVLEKIIGFQETTMKFRPWIQNQFFQPIPPQENMVLRERIGKGALHFVKELSDLISFLATSPASTDNRLHAKEYNETLRELFSALSLKRYTFQACTDYLDIGAWQKAKQQFTLPSFAANSYGGASEQRLQSPHPILYQQLRKFRDSICARTDMPIYMVAGSKSLLEMAEFLPMTDEALVEINGFGPARVEKYGQQFLDIIQTYCHDNGLETRIAEKEGRKEKKSSKKSSTKRASDKPDTKSVSLSMFQEGKSIPEIASHRNLSPGTIEGHLTVAVGNGTLAVEQLLSPGKLSKITNAITGIENESLTTIRQRLDEDISFGEIRFVLASIAYRKTSKESSRG
ncbi:MAG TPA: helix-turn-helix domain-containing protein [Chitinophagaceae bacterium]|nr:helix-turn-helix domain-containing protein [Chitinophagaceae bacterium]